MLYSSSGDAVCGLSMRKPTLKSCLIVVAVSLLLGTACRNGEAAAAPSGGVAGVYSGSITYYRFPGPVASKPRRLFGAVGKEGTGYFVSVSPVSGEVQVFRRLAGSGEITSPRYEVPAEGRAVARGVQKWKFKISSGAGGAHSRRLLGKFNRVDGYAALELRELPASGRRIPLRRRSGAYEGFDINHDTKVDITLYPDGRLGGTDASGCRISGRLSRVANLGVFHARMSFAGPQSCRTATTGVAFFDTHDRTGRFSGAGSYLYLIGASRDFSRGVAMVLRQRSH